MRMCHKIFKKNKYNSDRQDPNWRNLYCIYSLIKHCK